MREHSLADVDEFGGTFADDVYAEQGPIFELDQQFERPSRKPRICPREVSRKRAMPLSYGMPARRSSSSVWPTTLISGTP